MKLPDFGELSRAVSSGGERFGLKRYDGPKWRWPALDTWSPITAEELQSFIDEQLYECTDAQREIFERYRVPLRLTPLERFGKLESVFVVAQRGNEVMYYEDVEEGFNFSPLTPDGRIAQRWCNQDELMHALIHWST